ncbi:MAG: hypothetical protein Q8K75_08410 [Chlamydiales bacterium]|nr:hypothetical protein [Chlamydiales bacterium]
MAGTLAQKAAALDKESEACVFDALSTWRTLQPISTHSGVPTIAKIACAIALPKSVMITSASGNRRFKIESVLQALSSLCSGLLHKFRSIIVGLDWIIF